MRALYIVHFIGSFGAWILFSFPGRSSETREDNHIIVLIRSPFVESQSFFGISCFNLQRSLDNPDDELMLIMVSLESWCFLCALVLVPKSWVASPICDCHVQRIFKDWIQNAPRCPTRPPSGKRRRKTIQFFKSRQVLFAGQTWAIIERYFWSENKNALHWLILCIIIYWVWQSTWSSNLDPKGAGEGKARTCPSSHWIGSQGRVQAASGKHFCWSFVLVKSCGSSTRCQGFCSYTTGTGQPFPRADLFLLPQARFSKSQSRIWPIPHCSSGLRVSFFAFDHCLSS